MMIKKRLATGAMAATLGISLVGVGTFAAFNDVEQVSGSVAAGQLELSLDSIGENPIDFMLANLKPGDHMTRIIELKNEGTLAIKDVLLSIENVEFSDYNAHESERSMGGEKDEDTWGENSVVEYLNQFNVTVVKVGNEGSGDGEFPKTILENVSLGDFYLASGTIDGNRAGASASDVNAARHEVWNSVDQEYIEAYSKRLNVATVNPNKWTGLPVVPNDPDQLKITIKFNNDKERNDDGTYVQNKFQGDKAKVQFMFEARQWNGQDVSDESGKVESNEEAKNGDF